MVNYMRRSTQPLPLQENHSIASDKVSTILIIRETMSTCILTQSRLFFLEKTQAGYHLKKPLDFISLVR